MLRIVAASLSLAVLALASAGPAQAQTKELVMGNVNPPKHGTSQTSQQFIDKLAELTGGKVKIVHHHSGALGGEREVAQQIQLGTVDFGPITTAPLSTLVPEMSVFQLPYIFRDYQHVYTALDGSFVDPALAEATEVFELQHIGPSIASKEAIIQGRCQGQGVGAAEVVGIQGVDRGEDIFEGLIDIPPIASVVMGPALGSQ